MKNDQSNKHFPDEKKALLSSTLGRIILVVAFIVFMGILVFSFFGGQIKEVMNRLFGLL